MEIENKKGSQVRTFQPNIQTLKILIKRLPTRYLSQWNSIHLYEKYTILSLSSYLFILQPE